MRRMLPSWVVNELWMGHARIVSQTACVILVFGLHRMASLTCVHMQPPHLFAAVRKWVRSGPQGLTNKVRCVMHWQDDAVHMITATHVHRFIHFCWCSAHFIERWVPLNAGCVHEHGVFPQ